MSEKEKFLGEFEQCILLSILRLGENAYGSSVRELLSDVVNREVSIGALYTTLEGLETKGMVSSRVGEATAQRGGRAKKYFEVTAKGQQALKRSKQALEKLWKGVALSVVLQGGSTQPC